MTATSLDDATASSPVRLELFYSRWRALLSLLFTCACALAFAYGCYGVSFAIGKEFAQILSVPFALFLLWRIYRAFNILRWRGPVVVLDEEGISDLRRGNVTIPWAALRGFSHGSYRNRFGIILKFKDTRAAQHYLGRSVWIESIALKMQFENGEVFIALSSLRYRYKTIVASLNAFLKYAATRAATH